VEDYRRKYENVMGETGLVREELKRAENQVRELQNEVEEDNLFSHLSFFPCFFLIERFIKKVIRRFK
jgi:hypothetical protein